MTQKGQVTIPADIRKFLGVKSGDKIAFIKTYNEIVVKPAGNFLQLKGSVSAHRKYSDKEADKAILQYIKEKHDSKTAGN